MTYFPSRHDHQNVEGLCGVFGRMGNNALRVRNNGPYPGDTGFKNAWEARTDERIFNGQHRGKQCPDDIHTCHCDGDDDSGEDVIMCNQGPVTQRDTCFQQNDELPALFAQSRFAEQRGVPLESLNPFGPHVTLRQLKSTAREVSPATKTYDNATATAYCTNHIAESESVKSCMDIIKPADVDAHVWACASDLMITGDNKWAQDSLGTLIHNCRVTLSKNITMWEMSEENNETFVPPADIEKNLCPGSPMCSGHGSCSDHGYCECDEGYGQFDCSLHITDPPQVEFIGYDGICDHQSQICDNAHLAGYNFVPSSNLTCHMKELKVSPDDPGQGDQVIEGQYWSINEVRCPVKQLSAQAFNIRISNDGEHQSDNEFTFISFDSMCQSCDLDANPICTKQLQPSACEIDQMCLRSGDVNPAENQSCFVCNPSFSQDTWTLDTTSCHIDNVCYSSGNEDHTHACLKCNPNKDQHSWTLDDSSCFINETCQLHGEVSPDKVCLACDTSNSQEDWTIDTGTCHIEDSCFDGNDQKPGKTCLRCKPLEDQKSWTLDSNSCYIEDSCFVHDATHPQQQCLRCDADKDQHTWKLDHDSCYIENECFGSGQQHINKSCLSCEPTNNQHDWKIKGDSCHIHDVCYTSGEENPQKKCFVCDPAASGISWELDNNSCHIEEQCYTTGEKHPSQQCLMCDATKNQESWEIDTNTCFIDNNCLSAGSSHPTKECLQCDPLGSNNDWTMLSDACYIENECLSSGASKPNVECFICNPDQNQDDWVKTESSCFISNICFPSGDHNPAQFCQVCDPSADGFNWTLSEGSCFIDGQCYATGSASTENNCGVCDPGRDQHKWTNNCSGMKGWEIALVSVGCIAVVSVSLVSIVFMKKKQKVRPTNDYELQEEGL